MLGYAAFALCGPKYVRDICPNKAKPALGALHTVSLRGRGKLLVGFASLQSQCCDATVHCAGTVVFMCCKLPCVFHCSVFVLRSLAHDDEARETRKGHGTEA